MTDVGITNLRAFVGWKNICTKDGRYAHDQMHKTDMEPIRLVSFSVEITVISGALCPAAGPDVFSRRRGRKNVWKRESFCNSGCGHGCQMAIDGF